MYPAAFDYVAPTSLDEALDALEEYGDEAQVLAGGQSLIPMMKLRLAMPRVLIDINRVPDLDGIEEVNGHLNVGALVRHDDVAHSDLVTRKNHTMCAAAPWISDPLVRNRGTVCGSVANCDPEGDWNSVMLAVGARVVARSASGERTIPIADFVVDFFTNSLEPNELVTEVRVPTHSGSEGGAYLKLERKVGDYATAAVATHLRLAPDGTIGEAGIALTSVASKNLKIVEAEELLTGEDPSEELFAEAAEIAAREARPHGDVRGSADFKRNVVRVYTRRGLATALDVARAN